MDPAELNKRFIISFLHVQGKLITKIGYVINEQEKKDNLFITKLIILLLSQISMESFHTCAAQMLKEFRALMLVQPIPINSHRLLQLISLNMYAIDCNALNCTEMKGELKHFNCSFLFFSKFTSVTEISLTIVDLHNA